MAILSKKQPASCSVGCKIMKMVSTLLLFVVAVAALVGVYETHVITGTDASRMMLQFGSTSGSLAIVAFVLSFVAFLKHMCACMAPCAVCSK